MRDNFRGFSALLPNHCKPPMAQCANEARPDPLVAYPDGCELMGLSFSPMRKGGHHTPP